MLYLAEAHGWDLDAFSPVWNCDDYEGDLGAEGFPLLFYHVFEGTGKEETLDEVCDVYDYFHTYEIWYHWDTHSYFVCSSDDLWRFHTAWDLAVWVCEELAGYESPNYWAIPIDFKEDV